MAGVANGVAKISSLAAYRGSKFPKSNAFPGASSYLSKTIICPPHLRRSGIEKRQMKFPERQAWVTADVEETYEQRLAAPRNSEMTYPKHPVTG